MLIYLFSSVTPGTGPTHMPPTSMRMRYQTTSTGCRRSCRSATVTPSEFVNRVIPYDLRNPIVGGGTGIISIMSRHTLKMQALVPARTAGSEGKPGKWATVLETTPLSSLSATKYEIRFRLQTDMNTTRHMICWADEEASLQVRYSQERRRNQYERVRLHHIESYAPRPWEPLAGASRALWRSNMKKKKKKEASLLGRRNEQHGTDFEPLIDLSARDATTPVKSTVRFGNGYGRSSREGRGRPTGKASSAKHHVPKHVHFR